MGEAEDPPRNAQRPGNFGFRGQNPQRTGLRAIQRTWNSDIELGWKLVDFVGREVEGSHSCAQAHSRKSLASGYAHPGLPHIALLLYSYTTGINANRAIDLQMFKIEMINFVKTVAIAYSICLWCEEMNSRFYQVERPLGLDTERPMTQALVRISRILNHFCCNWIMHTAILLGEMPAMETRPKTPPSSYAPNPRDHL